MWFRLSSMEVVFQGGHLPDLKKTQNSFELYFNRPTFVTKYIFMIPCYLSHLPLRSSFLQVSFYLFNISRVLLSSTREDLQILQSKFSCCSCYFTTIAVSGSCSCLSGSCSNLSGSCSYLYGSCSCLYDGGNENKAKLSPAETWNCGWPSWKLKLWLSLATIKI